METILLVEDDAREQRAIATFLKNRGHEVLTASNGKQAETLFAQAPDIIVTDLKMAGADGLEVLRAAHQELPETPVISSQIRMIWPVVPARAHDAHSAVSAWHSRRDRPRVVCRW